MKLVLAVLLAAAFAWWLSRAQRPTRGARSREKFASCAQCGIYFPATTKWAIPRVARLRCPECGEGELKIFMYG